MGIFSFMGRKKVSSVKPSKDVPLSRVEDLVSKGLSKRQIIDYLRKEGYSVDLVEKAFLQMNSKQGALSNSGAPVSEQLPALQPSGIPLPKSESQNDFDDVSDDSLEPSVENEITKAGDVESLVEVIVEEKFAELADKVEDFDNLKDSVDSKISSFNSEIDSIKSRISDLEKFRDENMVSQKKALDDFRLEITAIEKAFHKLVPAISSNVRKMRESHPIEKEENSSENDDFLSFDKEEDQ